MKLAKILGRVLFLVTVAAATPMTFGQASKKDAAPASPTGASSAGPKRDGISAIRYS